jgi:prepilin-type processing-associated H-X9-DG protein/prepilin-type N-terminal cleavage/methylation domain-containing protein
MRRKISGFTLVELLVSMTIIVMLIGLIAPQFKKVTAKAQSTKCLNNLRQVGVSAMLYAADNNNRFPLVESMPSDEVYDEDVDGVNPKPLYETLEPYGLSRDTLKCPTDIAGLNYFAKEGSSYMWRNVADGELTSNVNFYGRRGTRQVSSTYVVIATDYDRVHSGRSNRLYADGHVRDGSNSLKR